MLLQEALVATEVDNAAVSVQFGEREGGGLFAAVDERGRLAETGWQAFPMLMCAAPASQYSAVSRVICFRVGLEAMFRVLQDILRVRARWQDYLEELAPVPSGGKESPSMA